MNEPNNESLLQQPVAQNGSTPAVPKDNFDKLVAGAMKLLRHQQDRASALESNYQQQRAAMLDGFRAQVDELRRQTEEQVLAMDTQYRVELEAIMRTITALKALRGA